MWFNKVYVVIVEDRHCDIDVLIFTDKETAISAAKRIAKKYQYCDDDYKENPNPEKFGWIYHVVYSCEGDNVVVVEREIDKVIPA